MFVYYPMFGTYLKNGKDYLAVISKHQLVSGTFFCYEWIMNAGTRNTGGKIPTSYVPVFVNSK